MSQFCCVLVERDSFGECKCCQFASTGQFWKVTSVLTCLELVWISDLSSQKGYSSYGEYGVEQLNCLTAQNRFFMREREDEELQLEEEKSGGGKGYEQDLQNHGGG